MSSKYSAKTAPDSTKDAVLRHLEDKEAVDKLLARLAQKSRFLCKTELDPRWGSLRTLPSVVESWVKAQTEPFLAVKLGSGGSSGFRQTFALHEHQNVVLLI